ncbi:transposase [Colletotrichum incanum]|nr:transposase [Colletotrichum incanum]
MDKTGILKGKGSNGLVLGSSEVKAIQRKQPGSQAWVSIIEFQQQWFPLDLRPYTS